MVVMLVILLSSIFCFTSCNKEDEEPQIVNSESRKFVGTWKDERADWTWTYTLRSDGTCSSKYVSKSQEYSWLNSITEGQWSYGLNILTLIPNDGRNRHTWVVTQVSDNRITVVEDGESIILIRVN